MYGKRSSSCTGAEVSFEPVLAVLCAWPNGLLLEFWNNRLRSLAHGLLLDSLWSFVYMVLSARKQHGYLHRKGRKRKPRSPRGRARRRARRTSPSLSISPASLPSVTSSSSASNVSKGGAESKEKFRREARARNNKDSGNNKRYGKNGNKKHGNKKNRAQKMKANPPVSPGIEPIAPISPASSPTSSDLLARAQKVEPIRSASSPAPFPTPSDLLARVQKIVSISPPPSPRASVTHVGVASTRSVPVDSTVSLDADVPAVPVDFAKPAKPTRTGLSDDPELAMAACSWLMIAESVMAGISELPAPEPWMEELWKQGFSGKSAVAMSQYLKGLSEKQ